MAIIRIYYEQLGNHIHMKVFSGSHDGALDKCGDLVMRWPEFNMFKESATFIQFVKQCAPKEKLD